MLGWVSEAPCCPPPTPNEFPEELPGMLQDHDIEFIIYLLHGMPPISKRP
jgi:hypothetical protein